MKLKSFLDEMHHCASRVAYVVFSQNNCCLLSYIKKCILLTLHIYFIYEDL
jgi:hypothetical protein